MEKQTTTEEKKKLSIREFFTLGEVGGYFFRKKVDISSEKKTHRAHPTSTSK